VGSFKVTNMSLLLANTELRFCPCGEITKPPRLAMDCCSLYKVCLPDRYDILCTVKWVCPQCGVARHC
jgi:hypothetical protein